MMDRTAGRVWTTEDSGDMEKSSEAAEPDAAGPAPPEEPAVSVSKDEGEPEHEAKEGEAVEPATEVPTEVESPAGTTGPVVAEPEEEEEELSDPPGDGGEGGEPDSAAPEVGEEPASAPGPEAPSALEPEAERPSDPAPAPPAGVPPASKVRAEKRRVLVVFPAASTGRLIRETLENFTEAEVDTSPDTIYGFELALKRRYHLFLFGLVLPHIDGPLLYELISKTHPHCHGGERTAPGVVFIREKDDPRPSDDVTRDARVKAILTKPLGIDRLLQSVEGTLEQRAPI